ncbi:TIGR03564 family F420-dependent LLM class oxidoreductase [Streptomyces sp. NPDC048636]|uniref:TIGR03564 family F420-dependent LLM class oxidoreductase n=1 Tax=Streptomyces sp. NPDC048636 TaxID=3155762 RepID=UPI0034454E4E
MSWGIALPAGDDHTGNLVTELMDQVREAAAAGIGAVWFAQRQDVDALTLAALAGQAVPGIRTGTSVVPIYPRHPVTLAAQARTAQAASAGRFQLGLGLSGKTFVEQSFGVRFDRPIRHLREYLTVLGGLLRDGAADFEGETLRARTVFGPVTVAGAAVPPVLVAAMGPQALRATGELADGTVPFLAAPRALAEYIVPTIGAAARAAGRPAPRVVAMVPALVTADVAAVRRRAREQFAFYEGIPSHRDILDRAGVERAGELMVIGDEETVAAGLRRYTEAGATELIVSQTGMGTDEERGRTWRLLGELSGPIR